MRYGDNDVLSGAIFDVAAGEVVALLGPNGVGNTTTIEIFEGFFQVPVEVIFSLEPFPRITDQHRRSTTSAQP